MLYVIGVQFAVSVTVAPFVGVKFLKYSLVTLVVPFHAVLTALELEPYFAVLVSNPVAVHPANVYPSFVGLLICTFEAYVPLVGAFAPAVPPFKL